MVAHADAQYSSLKLLLTLFRTDSLTHNSTVLLSITKHAVTSQWMTGYFDSEWHLRLSAQSMAKLRKYRFRDAGLENKVVIQRTNLIG